MDRAFRALDRLGLVVGWLSCVAILILVLAEILVRAGGYGLPFTSEYSSLLMAWLIFFPLSEVTRRRTHIAADFLVDLMNPRARAWIKAVGACLALVVYAGFLVYIAWIVMLNSYVNEVRTQGLMLTPLWYPQLGMLMGLGAMLLRALVELGRTIDVALRPGRQQGS